MIFAHTRWEIFLTTYSTSVKTKNTTCIVFTEAKETQVIYVVALNCTNFLPKKGNGHLRVRCRYN